MTDKSVIVAAVRTPFASFQGALSNMKSTDLGAAVIGGVVERSGLSKNSIEQVIMGCVLPGRTWPESGEAGDDSFGSSSFRWCVDDQ